MHDFGLIVVLPREWETYHRKQMVLAMAEVLGLRGVVVCVNRPLDAVASPLGGPGKIWFKWRTRQSREMENLHVFRPLLPLHEMIAAPVALLAVANSRLLKHQIKGFLASQGIAARRWILWLSSPVHWPLAQLMNGMTCIYEAFDDYCLTPDGKGRPYVERLERKVLKRSKLVFVTSEALLRTKGRLHSRVFLMENGLNWELFEREAQGEEPSDLAVIPQPRALYVGNFRNPIDVALLERVIMTLPAVYFVFLGPVESNMHKSQKLLSRLSNVSFLGARPHNLVPRYIAYSDVCLIPMRLNAYAENLHPYKLYEYFGLGKPVVSTDLPQVARFEKCGVYIARNADEFREMVQRAANQEPNSPLPEERKQVARDHDWRRIVGSLFDIIERELIPSVLTGTVR